MRMAQSAWGVGVAGVRDPHFCRSSIDSALQFPASPLSRLAPIAVRSADSLSPTPAKSSFRNESGQLRSSAGIGAIKHHPDVDRAAVHLCIGVPVERHRGNDTDLPGSRFPAGRRSLTEADDTKSPQLHTSGWAVRPSDSPGRG